MLQTPIHQKKKPKNPTAEITTNAYDKTTQTKKTHIRTKNERVKNLGPHPPYHRHRRHRRPHHRHPHPYHHPSHPQRQPHLHSAKKTHTQTHKTQIPKQNPKNKKTQKMKERYRDVEVKNERPGVQVSSGARQ